MAAFATPGMVHELAEWKAPAAYKEPTSFFMELWNWLLRGG